MTQDAEDWIPCGGERSFFPACLWRFLVEVEKAVRTGGNKQDETLMSSTCVYRSVTDDE